MIKFYKYWLMFYFLIVIFVTGIFTVGCSFDTITREVWKQIQLLGGEEKYAVEDAISGIENVYTDSVYGKTFWIELLGVFNKISGKRIILDNEDRYVVYKMDNGQLTWNYTGYVIDDYSRHYLEFSRELKACDIPLLYVQVPFKINKYDNQLPYGLKDESNLLFDEFLLDISTECDIYDLREEINSQQLNYSDMFYNTDHHWTAEAGLWASKILTEKLCNDYDLELEKKYLTDDNYSFTIFEDYMLGSQGKRTGLLYSGLDDFTFIEPTYETDYILDIPSRNIHKEGTYQETIMFMEYLKKDYYTNDPGRVYTGDNYSLMTIKNKKGNNCTKILLIKDSFSKSVIPSLASTCLELHVIDLRTFDGSVLEYAVNNEIDMVVVMYNPSVIVDSKFFEFN